MKRIGFYVSIALTLVGCSKFDDVDGYITYSGSISDLREDKLVAYDDLGQEVSLIDGVLETSNRHVGYNYYKRKPVLARPVERFMNHYDECIGWQERETKSYGYLHDEEVVTSEVFICIKNSMYKNSKLYNNVLYKYESGPVNDHKNSNSTESFLKRKKG